jgi:hypothetical protein
MINSCSLSLGAKRSKLVTSESWSYRLLRHFVPHNDELIKSPQRLAIAAARVCQFACTIPGGLQLPAPTGRMEGVSVLGQ